MGFGGKLTAIAAAATLLVSVTGCGSSSKSKPASAGSTTASSASGGAAVTTGAVHASFQAADHAPKIGKGWPYSVHVTDAGGHPLSGTVKIQFTFGGQVVGTDHPPVHPVRDGLWHDSLTFPPPAVGQPVTLQAVVHTSAGSVTLNWPVTAHK